MSALLAITAKLDSGVERPGVGATSQLPGDKEDRLVGKGGGAREGDGGGKLPL